MRRILSAIYSISRRSRRRLAVLSIATVLLGLVSPFLWAGYHAYAGERSLNRYHSAEARAHFGACLNVWPWSRSARLHLLAARAARREGDVAEATHLLYECQDTLGDNSPETLLEWAMLRAARGDLETTAEPLRQAARQDPRLIPLVLEALTEGYLTMSRILDALYCTDDWLALEPDNVQAWFYRGKIHRQVGAVQKVAADFQHVLDLDPQRDEARWWLALALLDIGRYEEAYQQLEMVQKQRTNDVEVRVRKAICLWRMDHIPQAFDLLDSVLAENPHHGLALRTRGQIASIEGRFAEAEPWLREAARVLPYDYITQNALWECLRQQGKTTEAETQKERKELLFERRQRQNEILAHLMSQKPDDPVLQTELGTLYFQLGSPHLGEAWLLNALRLNEHYVPALEALARHYRELGESERAELYHRQARESAAVKTTEAKP